MTLGTRKKTPSESGAPAITSARSRQGRSSSSRIDGDVSAVSGQDLADLSHGGNRRGVELVELRDVIEDRVKVAQHRHFFGRGQFKIGKLGDSAKITDGYSFSLGHWSTFTVPV